MSASSQLPVPQAPWLATRLAGRAPAAPWYVRDLLTMVGGVLDLQAHVLGDTDRHLLAHLLHLPTSALALLVRLHGRRHPAYLPEHLDYPTLDLDAAINALHAAGLANGGDHLDDSALLAVLTRAELLALLPAAPGQRSLRRDALVACCLATPAALQRLRRLPWVALVPGAGLQRLLLLYFGNPWQDLSAFVVRDLGHVTYERYPLSAATTLFRAPGELDRACELLEWRATADAGMAAGDAAAVRALLGPLWQREPSTWLERRRSRLLNRMGRWFERQGQFDAALDAWARSSEAPARERRIRVLLRLGDTAAAHALCRAVLVAPADDPELALARRTLDGHRERRRLFRPAELRLGCPGRGPRVERLAAEALGSEGRVVFHTENRLPGALFALAFWDILFAPVPGAFTHPFQTGPLDLAGRDFRRDRAALVEARLAELRNCADLGARLRPVLARKYGLANAFVYWPALPLAALELALDHLRGDQLAGICDRLSRRPGEYRRGFPDLVAFGPEPGRMEFLEVKGPGDQLQPHQRQWLRTFDALGIPARVLRLELP